MDVLGAPPRTGQPLRVLLVEDDDGDAFLVTELLADLSEHIVVRRVDTLASAVSAPLRADCVLLDLQLPDAVGLTALTRLRQHSPETAVVVLTGQRDEAIGVAAVAAGAQDYLVKDQVDGLLLVKAMRYAWERKRAEEAERQLLQQQLVADENRRLERGLLPAPLISDENLNLVARYRPGRDGSLLGGDFYDAAELPDGTVEVVIGDVSGHGPDEAALGVALRIGWRSLVLAGLPTSEVLRTVEKVLLHERINHSFVTLCTITIRPDRRSLRMRLAGHPPPLLIEGDAGRLLPMDNLGVPLGLMPDAVWEPVDVDLRPGWSLLLYTDGVFEGKVKGQTERLGHENMANLLMADLRANPGWRQRPGVVLDKLIAAVEELNEGPLDDDVALALLSHGEIR
ncbi:serine phosphatase RsbU (regulator of sigma subunit) [Kibdelosporangium banguiense]|uniref:Serine phosphatase RsbU (Regulator of sigma subunit) n=1 Tax=Kibdelosporangium banguiense TaxID=1365924 RepID=A0ABS4U0U7_9PSEU|nr:SpoIIE family protein phosphatase [Kibdelosporangium banguiense]MBP2329859.1 serine phosphatase RsbU (regulator of sigma subunit) [Kibdelosporangium banguiense]